MYDLYRQILLCAQYDQPGSHALPAKSKRDQQTSSGDAKITLELWKGFKASVLGSVLRDSYIDNFYATINSEYSLALGNGYAGGGQATKSTH